jgi:glyoxylate reductase
MPFLYYSAHKEWAEKIESIAEVKKPNATARTEFLEECKSGAFDGCVAAYRTFGSFSITGMIDEEVVAVLPKSLKYICHNGPNFHFWKCYARTDR